VNNIIQEYRLQTIDEQVDPGKIRLKILFDKSSLEVFFGNGEKVLTTYLSDEDSDNLWYLQMTEPFS
jgi:sucrose-6-phosphate hydrolase SacC (GH32 family)